MADDNDIDEIEETATAKKPLTRRAPSLRIPRSAMPEDGKARVETKITYETDAPDNEDTKNKTTDQNGSGANAFQSANLARQFQTQSNGLPENRLINLFGELADVEEFEGETFMAFITRRQDMMNDSFSRPSTNSETFPPFQITSSYLTSFIPTIQKYNGNSGGRFDIVITDSKGADLEIGLAGFVIPNPLTEEKNIVSDNNNGMLSTILEMNKASEQRFERLITELTKPQEDTFLTLVKTKMQQDFLNPPAPNKSSEFNTDEFLAKTIMSQQVAQTLADKFSQTLGAGSGDTKEKGTLEMLLGNQMLVDRASELVTNIFDIVGDLVAAKQQAAYTQNPVQGQQGQPPPPPQQITPEQVQQQNQNNMNIETIDKIITELESDNEITLENETLKALALENPSLFDQLKQLAGILQFEALFGQLEQLLPDKFNEFYVDDTDELNERGIKIKARLEILHRVLGEKPPEAETAKA